MDLTNMDFFDFYSRRLLDIVGIHIAGNIRTPLSPKNPSAFFRLRGKIRHEAPATFSELRGYPNSDVISKKCACETMPDASCTRCFSVVSWSLTSYESCFMEDVAFDSV